MMIHLGLDISERNMKWHMRSLRKKGEDGEVRGRRNIPELGWLVWTVLRGLNQEPKRLLRADKTAWTGDYEVVS